MSDVEPKSPVEGLVGRILSLLLHPADTWDVIDEEYATVEGLYRSWVLPLAAVQAVARAVGELSFHGIRIFGMHYQPSVVTVLGHAVANYGLTLIGVYVLAVLIDQFARQFGGERSQIQALKVSAYSATAAWVGGAFMLLPTAGDVFALLGAIYSLYLLYLGLPKLMKSDPNLTLNYFALTLVMAFVLALVIGGLSSCVGDIGGPIRIY